MTIVKILTYAPELDCRIVNTEHLPRGLGTRYLLCVESHMGTLIAHSWRHNPPPYPNIVLSGYVLIDFKRSTK